MNKKSLILTVPDERLRHQAVEITNFDVQLKKKLEELATELIKSEGVGLAGPQIGWERRVFATNLNKIWSSNDNDDVDCQNKKEKDKILDKELQVMIAKSELDLKKRLKKNDSNSQIVFFINPKITSHQSKKDVKQEDFWEGCLSLPNLFAPIPRYRWIELESIIIGADELKKLCDLPDKNKIMLRDYLARNVQHEIDHLDGILFTDYLKNNNIPLYFDDKETGKMLEVADKEILIESY